VSVGFAHSFLSEGGLGTTLRPLTVPQVQFFFEFQFFSRARVRVNIIL